MTMELTSSESKATPINNDSAPANTMATPVDIMFPSTNITSARDADNLSDHLENLPQELYDQIFNLTLTCDLDYDPQPDTNWSISIDKSYRPPVQLQLSRVIRERVCSAYYGRTVFKFPGDARDRSSRIIARMWLDSVPQAVMSRTWTVRLESSGEDKRQWAFTCAQPCPPDDEWSLHFQGRRQASHQMLRLWDDLRGEQVIRCY